jgi:hypothetical protein
VDRFKLRSWLYRPCLKRPNPPLLISRTTSSICRTTNLGPQLIEGEFRFATQHVQVLTLTDMLVDRYSLKDGQSFVEQARNATFDLAGDDGVVARRQGFSQLTWDRKKKKFVQGDGTGSDNKKLVKTESGARLPASFRSGRFDEWKAKKRVVIPKVGDAEGDHARGQGSTGMNKYRHNNSYEAKPLDPKSTTYEKKVYMQKKKAEKAAEADGAPGPKTGYAGQKARSELRDVNAIRRDRKVQEQVCASREKCEILRRGELISLLASIEKSEECKTQQKGRQRGREGRGKQGSSTPMILAFGIRGCFRQTVYHHVIRTCHIYSRLESITSFSCLSRFCRESPQAPGRLSPLD